MLVRELVGLCVNFFPSNRHPNVGEIIAPSLTLSPSPGLGAAAVQLCTCVQWETKTVISGCSSRSRLVWGEAKSAETISVAVTSFDP